MQVADLRVHKPKITVDGRLYFHLDDWAENEAAINAELVKLEKCAFQAQEGRKEIVSRISELEAENARLQQRVMEVTDAFLLKDGFPSNLAEGALWTQPHLAGKDDRGERATTRARLDELRWAFDKLAASKQ